MLKCKKKAFGQIQAYPCIFWHIQTYPDIIRHFQPYSEIIQLYSVPCVTLGYSELQYIQHHGIFKTRVLIRALVYPKLWHIHRHIQNPELFRVLGYSEPEAYSKSSQTSTVELFGKQLTTIIIFASYNYFHNFSFSCPLVHEINMIFNAGLIFTPEVFILCKKVWVPRSRSRGP